MTIQRQYSLPNCTLILEGMGDNRGSAAAEPRPLMTVLLNAYCHIAGQDPPLAGGREFLEGLVNAVSQYTQRLLSGVHPAKQAIEQPLVQLQQVDGSHHRLTVQSDKEAPDAKERSLDLTTVQLFDLVEAVDQFLADRQTLPDVGLNLQPLSKKYVRDEQPLAKRSIPAAIGVSGLAAATVLLSMLPPLKVVQPKCLFPTPECTAVEAKDTKKVAPDSGVSPSPAASTSPSSNPAPAALISPATEPSPSPAATETQPAPEITDAAKLATLSKQLQTKLDQAWKGRKVPEELVYRVSVASNNTIRGYDFGNDEALTNVKLTPLPELLKVAKPNAATPEPLADFKVLFTPTGLVEVAPWKQATPSISENPEITETAKLEEILPKVRSQLTSGWQAGDRTLVKDLGKDLEFQLRVKPDGTIETYRPNNQPAFDYNQNTPLPKIAKQADREAAQNQAPHALFKAVFTANGRIEISPWRGWNR